MNSRFSFYAFYFVDILCGFSIKQHCTFYFVVQLQVLCMGLKFDSARH